MDIAKIILGIAFLSFHVAIFAQPYEVGNYYEDATKRGVVIEVDGSKMHGKIISLDQAYLPWAVEEVHATYTGANSAYNGKANQAKIMSQYRWIKNYPALAWCATKGKEWYLPAPKELENLLFDYYKKQKVSNTLIKLGYQPLANMDTSTAYWSSQDSMEYNSNGDGMAFCLDMYVSRILEGLKIHKRYVRAFAEF